MSPHSNVGEVRGWRLAHSRVTPQSSASTEVSPSAGPGRHFTPREQTGRRGVAGARKRVSTGSMAASGPSSTHTDMGAEVVNLVPVMGHRKEGGAFKLVQDLHEPSSTRHLR